MWAIWPIFASKCRFCVNPECKEISKSRNARLRRYAAVRVVSPETVAAFHCHGPRHYQPFIPDKFAILGLK